MEIAVTILAIAALLKTVFIYHLVSRVNAQEQAIMTLKEYNDQTNDLVFRLIEGQFIQTRDKRVGQHDDLSKH